MGSPGRISSPLRQTAPVLLTVIGGLLITFPAWANNLYFADDAHLAYESQHFGFWGPTRAFLDEWGFYRIAYIVLLSPIYALAAHLWVVKVIGALLHAGNAVLASTLWRRLGGGNLSGLTVLASVLVYPFVLEAVVWPATMAEYALGPFVLLSGALISIGRRSRSALYGGVLMGGSLLFHEQLLAPLIVLTILLSRRTAMNRGVLLTSVGAAGGLAVALVFLSFDTNSRLSGPAGPSLTNVLANLPYIVTQLRRSTPFGDFFWHSGGVLTVEALLMACVAIALVLIWLRATPSHEIEPPRVSCRLDCLSLDLVV